MRVILVCAGLAVFIMGLMEWARGGASLWRIFSIRREEYGLDAGERRDAENEVRQLERATDRALHTSFRILGFLAIFVWLLLGVSVVLDLLGVDWSGAFSSRAHLYWSTNTGGEVGNAANRSNILRSLGSNMRK